MTQKRAIKKGNPDLRRRVNSPTPEIPQFTEELLKHLSPILFTPLKYIQGNHEKMMRDRLLNLPVMVALVVSLVYRQITGLSEAARVIKEEGLLWVKPLKVSKQALSQRLMSLPSELFIILLNELIEKIGKEPQNCVLEKKWEKVRKRFSVVWIADGSTLEQLRRKLKIAGEKEKKLGGKILTIVEAFTSMPIKVWYEEKERHHDKNWSEEISDLLPKQGLILIDLGFFCFKWFDHLTETNKYFLTRLRGGVKYETKQVLSQGTYYKDEIIKMGKYRSNPCKHEVRLVSLLWGKTWYYYLTNVWSPEDLSPQEVCELYRRRWKIEEAFLLTKRLLGLAYLWNCHSNGIQIQVLATLIFYTVLNHLVGEVAVALNQPKDKISVEMVFRSLYYVAKAIERGENPDTVTYLAEREKLFGLIKATRKRHREKDALSQQIWQAIPLSG